MQVKKKPRNAAAKKIQKASPKEKCTKKEQTEQPLLKRMIFGEERPDLTELEAGSTTILDILAPTTVDTKSKDYIVVDGVYHTYLYITGYGYATTVGSCWLAPLVEAGEGVNMSFLVKRQSKEKILSKIAQTTMVNRSRMRDVGDTRQDYEELDTRYLSVVLSRYVTGSAAAMASRNSIDLDNKYIVLDLSGMPDDMIADGTFWATSIAYDLIMSCESDLSALLADELWSLVGATANPQAAGFVLEMVKTIRGLGGIAVTSTQGMQDLFGLDGGSYGKGILDASRIKLVMQMEEQEARLIQDKLNLSEDEVRQITRFRRGEGLLCIGYNHVPVAFHTTPKEYEAITTSPTDLRRGRSEYGDE